MMLLKKYFKNAAAKYTLAIAGLIFLLSCSRAQSLTEEQVSLLTNKKILIVYLSRTKNTKAVAEIIHQSIGGDLVALELATPYPDHYQTMVKQVANENAIDFLPPLKTKIDSIDSYDIVFVGFPTWGMQLPPPIKSFLKQYSLRGKTIIPFNTNAGYGIGSSFQTVKELCPGSKLLEGYSTKGGIERDGVLFVMEGEKLTTVQAQIEDWLKKIKMLKTRN